MVKDKLTDAIWRNVNIVYGDCTSANHADVSSAVGVEVNLVLHTVREVPPNDPKLSDSRPTATATDTARSGTAARVRNG